MGLATLLLYFTYVVISIALLLLVGFYLYYRRQFQYWKKKNLFYLQPSFPFGNIGGSGFKKNFGETLKDLYNQTKDHKIVGIWTFYKPSILVNDVEIIKDILVKNFNSFQDRGIHYDEEEDPLSGNLFFMGGTPWRNLRVKLTPTFTSGKMKMMFHTVTEAGDELTKYLEKYAKEKQMIEVRDILARFGTDVISSCAFGIETNSIEHPDSEFRRMGQKFFERTTLEIIKITMNFVVPEIGRFFKFRNIQKELEGFFLRIFDETISYRQKNKIERKDFLQLLIQMMNKGYIDDVDYKTEEKNVQDVPVDQQKFSMKEAAAQALVFFLAGFETSATTVQFALYELALCPEMQEKTRQEVDRVLKKYDGKLTYEGIQDMEYLDCVISETLRKYPPAMFLNRICNKNYKVPDSDLVIEKDTVVLISMYGIQNDSQHFPNPDKFDPDRFTEEEKRKRHHYSYFPFGEGPRVCIGNRFALMQTKVAAALLLSKFRFDVCEKTPIPIKFDATTQILQVSGGMFLRISMR